MLGGGRWALRAYIEDSRGRNASRKFRGHALGILAICSFQKVRLVLWRPEWLGRLHPCAQVPDVSDCLCRYAELIRKPGGEAVTLCAVVLGGIEDEDSIVRRDCTHSSTLRYFQWRGSSRGGPGIAVEMIILSKRYAALLLNKPRPEIRMWIHVVMLLLSMLDDGMATTNIL